MRWAVSCIAVMLIPPGVNRQTPVRRHMNTPESTNQIKFAQALDARGLNCPLPILKAKLALNKMQAGEILYVEATDPHSIIDFEAYCARTGHEIIQTNNNDGEIEFYIRRAVNPKKI